MKRWSPASLRNGLLAATWLAGTLLATTTVYAAVSAVASQVTDQGPAPISEADIEHALSRPSQAAAVPSPSEPSESPAVPSPSPSGDPTPNPSPNPAGHTPGPPATPAATSRTFALVGGTASVSCRGGSPSLNWATPNPGFEVETGSSDGGAQVEVRFRSDTHESRLEAWCSGATVQGSVQEETS